MQPRKLTIIHYNDAYTIEERKTEPVGGAPRHILSSLYLSLYL